MILRRSTRFANLTARSALPLIVIVSLAIIYGVMVSTSTPTSEQREPAGADLKYQRRIVERIRAGEGYYEAAGEELHKRGYATGSVFNWRLPLLVWLLARLPSTMIAYVLGLVLASVALLIWIGVLGRAGGSRTELMLGSLALLAPVIYGLSPGVFLAHEFWAGTLISLSLAAYARGWRWLALISGLLALFLRELTLPFVCVMLALACLEGRRREALVWTAGIVAFGIELLVHWSIIQGLMADAPSRTVKGGWIVFGSWRFVLSTARTHPYLLLAPRWVTAVVLPLAILGLVGWRGRLLSRVATTVCVYVLAFLFVGLPYNRYWGLMYVSVMPLGLLLAPQSLRDLWRSLWGKRSEDSK